MNCQKGSNKTQLIVNGTTRLRNGMGIQLTCKLQVTVNVAYSDRIRVTNIFCLNVKLLHLAF